MEARERIEDYHVPGCKCAPCVKERDANNERAGAERLRLSAAEQLCAVILETSESDVAARWFDIQCQANRILKAS